MGCKYIHLKKKFNVFKGHMIGKKDWNLLEIKILGNNAKYIIKGYVVN